MATVLAILMVLGIFVVIPAVIGFAIVGAALLWDRWARRSQIESTANLAQTIESPSTS